MSILKNGRSIKKNIPSRLQLNPWSIKALDLFSRRSNNGFKGRLGEQRLFLKLSELGPRPIIGLDNKGKWLILHGSK